MTTLRLQYDLEEYESDRNDGENSEKLVEGLHSFFELGHRFDFNFFVSVNYDLVTHKWFSEGNQVSMNRSNSLGNV